MCEKRNGNSGRYRKKPSLNTPSDEFQRTPNKQEIAKELIKNFLKN